MPFHVVRRNGDEHTRSIARPLRAGMVSVAPRDATSCVMTSSGYATFGETVHRVKPKDGNGRQRAYPSRSALIAASRAIRAFSSSTIPSDACNPPTTNALIDQARFSTP